AFHLFDTFGFPLELTQELAKERGIKVDTEGFKLAFEKHKEISRAGVEKKFGGIGYTPSYEATKLHTATHLLHAALRKILGESVRQMGSDITSERLRFDFSYPRKLTQDELKKIEDLVNQKIKEDLKVIKKEMTLKEALASGALAFFKEKYPEKVTVYEIGDFSKEICAGPHVKNTGELGKFKIVKEESAGAGIRRIKGILLK
ncbi:alanine--tRNA ligase, partial [Candidatus Parcubacteria bacterium]|nr:alanine--tRNA ligase [Candidatus Parcubacteria bacterium]